MGLLSQCRNVSIDFKGITLLDVLDKLKQENFFNSEQSIQLIEVLDDNHLVFGMPSNKITSAQRHELKYLEDCRELIIESKYKNYLFPGLLLNLLPLTSVILGGRQLIREEWKEIGLIFLGITIVITFFAKAYLINSTKNIEREIKIRSNHLLSEKGYLMRL